MIPEISDIDFETAQHDFDDTGFYLTSVGRELDQAKLRLELAKAILTRLTIENTSPNIIALARQELILATSVVATLSPKA